MIAWLVAHWAYLLIGFAVLVTLFTLAWAYIIDATFRYGEPGAGESPPPFSSAIPMPGTLTTPLESIVPMDDNPWRDVRWSAHYAAEQGEQGDEAGPLP